MDMVLKNEKAEDIMRYELKTAVEKFLSHKEYNKDMVVPEDILKELKYQALKLAYIRASAEVDYYDGSLLNQVCPEQPTRVLKQLKRIYVGLKSLDDNYSDERALSIIKHLVKSSAFKNRNEILELMIRKNHDKLTTNQIAEEIKIGRKTTRKELNILWNLGLVKRIETYRDELRNIYNYSWYPNKEHVVVKGIYKDLGLSLNIKEEKI